MSTTTPNRMSDGCTREAPIAQTNAPSCFALLPLHDPDKAKNTRGHNCDHTPDSLAMQFTFFLEDAQVANRSPATISFYRQKLSPFLNHLHSLGIDQPETIAPEHIRSFMSALVSGHSAGGRHAYWRAIRAFVRFLLREEILQKNPLVRVRAPKVDLEPLEPIDTSVLAAILATCDKSAIGLRDRSLLLTLLDTGLRAGEACALNIVDLDLVTGAIMVRRSKSRRPRTVFAGKRARRALAAYLAKRGNPISDEPLWLACTSEGDPQRFSYSGLRDIVRRRAKRAGVPAPALHAFRRGFAILMLRAGADVVSLSRMMGHGSLPVVMRYLKQESGDLQRVHEVCSPADQIASGSAAQHEGVNNQSASSYPKVEPGTRGSRDVGEGRRSARQRGDARADQSRSRRRGVWPGAETDTEVEAHEFAR